jgi:hypothetical protein
MRIPVYRNQQMEQFMEIILTCPNYASEYEYAQYKEHGLLMLLVYVRHDPRFLEADKSSVSLHL